LIHLAYSEHFNSRPNHPAIIDRLSRQSCPGGVGFDASSAKGHMGAVLVANLTRPGMTSPRSDGTWLPEWSDGMGERSGARSPVAWGLGQASLPVCRIVKIRLAGSLAWGRVPFDATGEHTSGERPGRRGVETAKFRRDFRVFLSVTFLLLTHVSF
jgi:hypothetical protein